MSSITVLNLILTASCIIGLGLSIYAYFVETAAEKNEQYTAMCDISDHISCTKAFKSKYGKGFGLVAENSIFNKPNSLLGIMFYSLLIVFVQSKSVLFNKACFYAIILSNVASVYFAYLLYFVVKTLCLVCVSTYVVNFVNLIAIYLKLKCIPTSTKIKEQ